ncbi:MAG TPA: RsmG family class I SAM-dependent methyltransferase [Acidimicrobiales bacterium]|nr:RsmG family class I SAM-dependent methyltransferase [Acidimicrobiales bacterium]
MNSDWLPRVLEESRARGFLGPQPIGPQIAHAEGFALCWETIRSSPPGTLLDLGSGGGLPGLVLLDRWGCHEVFLDSMEKRSNFLKGALALPGAPGDGQVITARAEDAARWPEFDETFDLVTSRSFGPPAVTAECAVRFLRVGGVLIVSEPPTERTDERWNSAGLALLGLVAQGRSRYGTAYEVLVKESSTPREYPRASGVPKKKPLF